LLDGIADDTSECRIEHPHQDSAEPSALESRVGRSLLPERPCVSSESTQLSPRLNRQDEGGLRDTLRNTQEMFFLHLTSPS
jgi:hypothetical protein